MKKTKIFIACDTTNLVKLIELLNSRNQKELLLDINLV